MHHRTSFSGIAVITLAALSATAASFTTGCSSASDAERSAVSASPLVTRAVCANGCPYSMPSQALAAAGDGDTIQVEAGTYVDCLYIGKNDITVTGVHGVAALTGKVCGQKGIIVTAGRNAKLANLELYGATNNDNYAGIRHDAAGFDLTLDNVFVHDNDDGILGSSNGDTIVIRNSRFVNNGMNASTGYAHNLYIGHAASFSFLNSATTHAKHAGHELKTRAAKTIIDGSVLATLDGFDSRLLDASNGGEVVIQNSVLQKSGSSDNPDLVGYAFEGLTPGITHSLTLVNSRIIDDKGRGPVVSFGSVPGVVSITGNTIVEPGSLASAGSPSGNSVFPTRSAAGYLPAPWLPDVPGAAAPPPAAPSPPTSTAGWTRCAGENERCAFSGTRLVRYGAGSGWVQRTLTDGVSCSNEVFGDPAYGTVKSCEIAPLPSWTRCAGENERCAFSGTAHVRYGAGGTWVEKTFSEGVVCSNDVFGDPVYGVAKSCEMTR
jgi:hypothetical protein